MGKQRRQGLATFDVNDQMNPFGRSKVACTMRFTYIYVPSLTRSHIMLFPHSPHAPKFELHTRVGNNWDMYSHQLSGRRTGVQILDVRMSLYLSASGAEFHETDPMFDTRDSTNQPLELCKLFAKRRVQYLPLQFFTIL